MNSLLRQARFQLEQDLERLILSDGGDVFTAKKSLVIIRDHCKKLSTLHLHCDFKIKEEAIFFFKELKCYYYSQLYYHQDIIEIAVGLPNGSIETKKHYLMENLHKLSEHFALHRTMYAYYRLGKTDFDEQYFSLISKHDVKLDVDGKEFVCEDDISSKYDLLYARVISNDRLEKYIHNFISELDQKENPTIPKVPTSFRSKFEWTASKASLVELLYGLHATRAINDGRMDINDLAEFASKLFPNVDVSDHSRTLVDIKNRKIQTKFINTMQGSLTEFFDKEESL